MSSQESKQFPNVRSGLSRRNFLKAGAAAVVVDVVLDRAVNVSSAADAVAAEGASADGIVSGPVNLSLTINGKPRVVMVEPRTTLLSAMRDRLEPAITGPKLVCDAGTCGACTVLLDGKPAYGCSLLAIDVVGREITTVEGLGTPDNLSPVQKAFCEKDAMMCGFCTSGFVTTVTAVMTKNPDATREEIQERCKGNFCRCGTFPHIFDAALAAGAVMKTNAKKA